MAAWRYSINYGPEGEANYANVYDDTGAFIGNLKTNDAVAVVAAMNAPQPAASDVPHDVVRAPRAAHCPGYVPDVMAGGSDCAECGWSQSDHALATPAPSTSTEEAKPCEYCDGTGDVCRADGEWLGTCDCGSALTEESAVVLRKDILEWRAEWLDANDPQDGSDCVTPFDKYLYSR